MSIPDTVTLPRPRRDVSRPFPAPTSQCVLYVTDFYLEEALLGIVEFARVAEWDLIANMRFHGHFPSERQADGIISTVNTTRVHDWLSERHDWPVVRILATPFEASYPAVEVDYYAAGKLGASHLMSLGHKHFAFYWMCDAPDAVELRKGFADEMAAHKCEVHWLSLSDGFPDNDIFSVPRDDRQAWLAEKLLQLPKPIAIMGDDDRRALEILRICDRIGLLVPEDVAIIGCDNHAVELGLARIPLSSVQIDFRAVGRMAGAMLQQIMEGETPQAPLVKIAPRGVAARRSTATFVADEPGITAAVLHLREHFHTPLRIEHLARIAGLSKRVFETQFRRYVGHSAREEIHRARLGCAARLLRDTNLKLDAIAIESGFRSGKYLSEAFSKFHGVGPTTWRLQGRNVTSPT